MPQSRSRTPKPDWLKVKAPGGDTYFDLKQILRSRNLTTVCEEARCPNIHECWNGGTATFMLMGEICTRGCRFCAVTTKREGIELDPFEPRKVAEAVAAMDLEYVVLTSVNRDDLPDQGSEHFAQTIRALKAAHPNVIRECLIPDFMGDGECLRRVVDAKPEVLAHNIETVRRLTPTVRDPRAIYDQSLEVLARSKKWDPEIYTKSSIMVGLGETEEEIAQTMQDLRDVDVDVLTLGQYLQPTRNHLQVESFIHPTTFERWTELGKEMGFLYVAAGPLVRSSYRAGEFFIQGVIEKKRAEEASRSTSE